MLELLIRLIIEGIQQASEAQRAATVQRVLRELGVPPGVLDLPTGIQPSQVESEVRRVAAVWARRLNEVLTTAQQALERAEAVERDLDATRGGRVFADVHRTRVKPLLLSMLPEFDRQLASATRGLPGQVLGLSREPAFRQVLTEVLQAVQYADVLGALAATRQDPEAALRMADADAIAEALLDPIQQFASDHGIAFPTQRPVAVPADPGAEAVWFGLLPEGHPVIFVPANFEADLYRYASVPHELGHVMWRDVPGLAAEVRRELGLPQPSGLWRMSGTRVLGSFDSLYAAWLPEIWADAMAILAIGPSALRGLAFSFAQPEDPSQVVTVLATEDQYDEHPPSHVRIHLAAHLLSVAGFATYAEAIRNGWDEQHGSPQELRVTVLPGYRIGVGADAVLARGRAAIDRLYEAQFVSLSGFRLADVPGFQMGPGLWARVKRRTEDLLSDKPFHEDGRVALAAAIEARAGRPALAAQITRGLRRAVLGRDAEERRVRDPSYERRRGGGGRAGFAAEMRDALLFREVLARRTGPPGLVRGR